MEHQELTAKAIGAAYAVHNELGGGFLESVYERALLLELGRVGLTALRQVPLSVLFRGTVVGEFFADIVVEDSVIIELKAVESLSKAHEVQLVNYLVATGKPVGLLINFGPERVEVRRKHKDRTQ
ncbi:MAG: GxxExxY protein [Lacipirellulaceae bacterium]